MKESPENYRDAVIRRFQELGLRKEVNAWAGTERDDKIFPVYDDNDVLIMTQVRYQDLYQAPFDSVTRVLFFHTRHDDHPVRLTFAGLVYMRDRQSVAAADVKIGVSRCAGCDQFSYFEGRWRALERAYHNPLLTLYIEDVDKCVTQFIDICKWWAPVVRATKQVASPGAADILVSYPLSVTA